MRRALILTAVMVLAGCGDDSGDQFTSKNTTATTAAPTTAGDAPSTTEGVSSGVGSKDASADVTAVQIIRTDDEYFPTVEVQATIANNSEKRSDYFVTIAVESPDGATRYEETYLSVDGLEPGQTATESTMLFEEGKIPADAVAVVKEVERTASL
jgi:hypothetical protein